jgi:hypothetical protein
MNFCTRHGGLLLIENPSTQTTAELLGKSGNAGEPQSCHPHNKATLHLYLLVTVKLTVD